MRKAKTRPIQGVPKMNPEYSRHVRILLQGLLDVAKKPPLTGGVYILNLQTCL